jgi:hypothetical protein
MQGLRSIGNGLAGLTTENGLTSRAMGSLTWFGAGLATTESASSPAAEIVESFCFMTVHGSLRPLRHRRSLAS